MNDPHADESYDRDMDSAIAGAIFLLAFIGTIGLVKWVFCE